VTSLVHSRKAYVALLAASLGAALFCVAYPLYVIRPWRRQGVQELKAALLVLRFQHTAELLCIALALGALGMFLRSRPRRGAGIGAIAGAALVLICAALSRVNVYEIMFHPAGAPSFQPASETKLDGSEKVLSVGWKSGARAYPIRAIAYHHLVNDVAGGVPIVATY
jgi:Protein of unknown function (DUF3179)